MSDQSYGLPKAEKWSGRAPWLVFKLEEHVGIGPLLTVRLGSDFAPERLLAFDPVLHMSAPVRRGAVVDARLGLAR